MNNFQDNQILRKALQSIARLKKARLDDLGKIAEIERTLAFLSSQKPNDTCRNCSKYDTCTEPCNKIENSLPKENQGYSHKERNYGDLIENIGNIDVKSDGEDTNLLCKYNNHYLNEIDRVRSDEIFRSYKNCLFIFTQNEWRVVTLRIEKGKTYKAIAMKMKITTSTASDTFRRAKKKMEKFYRKKYQGHYSDDHT